MQQKIKNLIKEALKNLGIEDVDFVVEHPEDLKNGDYSTNVAMAFAKKLQHLSAGGPREIAEKIAEELKSCVRQDLTQVEKIEVAGAGFINFYLSPKFFHGSIEEILNNKNFAHNNLFFSKKIIIEYTDPNPFKPFHIGHLMTNAIGESIARILEHSSASVSRANYQGDVGLHVAKAIYALLTNPEKYDLRHDTISHQASLIGQAYVQGSEAYENDPDVKHKINEINRRIYDRSDEEVNQIYDLGFKVTMEAFEDLYRMLGTKFEFYFLESLAAPIGESIVRMNLGRVFEESNGAIVFRAEKYDPKLHTRVFITQAGLPTYETKELGVTEEKFKTKPDLDLSIVITATEQMEYMKVVAKAISIIHPDYESKMKHITHGMMRLVDGKMSSRKGNILTGESLIRDTVFLVGERLKEQDWSEEEKNKIAEAVAVAALKYSILRQSTGGDIVFDFEKSISFEGDSGPYLQYSYVRAHSVIEKAQKENISPDPHSKSVEIFEIEQLLYRFPEVVLRSASEYEPHYIANYLIELARSFNSFYGNTIIVKKEDPTSPYKVALTYSFTFVMKKGLHLLGIEAPERM